MTHPAPSLHASALSLQPAADPYQTARRQWLRYAAASGMGAWLAAPAQATNSSASTNATSGPWPLPTELQALQPPLQAAGQARMRFLAWSVYDAQLWVAPGFAAGRYAQSVFALELRYLRALEGRAIAERSLTEMRRAGPVSAEVEQRWLASMVEAFPNVQAGDRITGLHEPRRGVRFFYNAQLRADVADSLFSERFFGIWLAEVTSEPALRKALLAGLA
jgi:Chalcone isomerase-like